MLLTADNKNDIDKYYRNTFVKFSNYAQWNEDFTYDPDTLFLIKEVHSDKITGELDDGTVFEIFYDDDNPIELKYPLPHKSFYQQDKTAQLLCRIPARQYKRGINQDNTSIFSIRSDGSVGLSSVSFARLNAYVKKQSFFSLAKALEKKSWASVVLAPRFAYVPKMGYILADTTVIAVVNSDKKINLVNSAFRTEIEQLLSMYGESGMFTIVE